MEKNRDTILLEKVLEAFRDLTGQKAVFIKGALEFNFGNKKIRFKPLVVTRVDEATIGLALLNKDTVDQIIVTKHIPPEKAEQLRELDLPFLDTAGNAYINRAPILIYVQGRACQKKDTVGLVDPFRQLGVKVIFALLCNPGLENQTYRKIAKEAGVALGGIGRILNELEEIGYLLRRKRGIRLINKGELLQRWVTAYVEKLHPKLVLDKYTAVERQVDLLLGDTILPGNAYWGGEVAAAKMVKHLVPRRGIIYIENTPNELAFKLRLKKDPDGNIELVKKFWRFPMNTLEPLAPPILVYANLLAAGNGRNIETAKVLYEEKIQRIIT
ncbi:MAG: hypothetical protein HRT89_14040 [Lentisphaeria bacterium]|nr:hypothetical protein [Lentisphaeria bacterium]NQZ69176.1 hypothetical protein [Lentisphaeria bacterium]